MFNLCLAERNTHKSYEAMLSAAIKVQPTTNQVEPCCFLGFTPNDMRFCFFFHPPSFFVGLSGQASFSSRKISQHLLLKQTQTPQVTVYPASTSIPRRACVVSHRLGSELGKFFQLEAAEQKLDKQSESQHCAGSTWYNCKDLTSKTSSDFTICKL